MNKLNKLITFIVSVFFILPLISCNGGNDTTTHYYLILGNIGAGKSTLINSIFGKVVADATPSLGPGSTTKKMTVLEHEGSKFIDTPGFFLSKSDIETYPSTSQEIKLALSLDGNYSIIYVLKLNDMARIQAFDLATLDIIAQAINGDKKISVIINQPSKKYVENDKFKNLWAKQLALLPFKIADVKYVFYSNEDIVPLDPEFKKWIKSAPTTRIMPTQVHDIKYEDLIPKMTKYEKKLGDLTL